MRALVAWLAALISAAVASAGPRPSSPRRPAWERVPASTREVDISERVVHPSRPPTRRRITAAGQVRRILAVFNHMPVVPPGAYSCPALRAQGAHRYDFSFRAGRRLVAKARFVAYYPSRRSDACDPVQLWVGRRQGPPLLGGDFLRRIARITGGR